MTRDTGDRTHEGLMLNSLGVTLDRLERHEEARTVLEESIEVTRAAGERLLEAHAHAALGDVAKRLGRLDTAIACYERALELRRASGDRAGEEGIARRIAEVRAAAGAPGRTS